MHLSTFYGAFWSTSLYQAPRTFLFNTFGNFDISVPAARHTRGTPWNSDMPYSSVVDRVLRHLAVKNNDLPNNQVYWETYNVPASAQVSPKLLAYISLHTGPQQLRTQGTHESMVVASLLNLDDVNNIERLMNNEGIVRNRAKIEATIGNAKATLKVQQEVGSLSKLIWSFAPIKPGKAPKSFGDLPASTPESHALSKELLKRGFKFVGPTTMYAAMQSLGLVNDHFANCHARH